MHDITEHERSVERAAYDADRATVAGIEHLRFFPLVTERSEGSILYTPSGRALIDFSASWGAASFGHADPRISDAVCAAVRRGEGVSVLSGALPTTTRLAERLRARIPVRSPGCVYLGLGGTDANSVAIRAARRATGRNRVVSFTGSYHGGHGLGQQTQGFGEDPGDHGLTSIFEYPLSAAMLRELAPRLHGHLARKQTACVIVEAVQCDGGVRVPADGFLSMLRQVCDHTGTLLICDEVKIGLGRTGDDVGYRREGVLPDLVTLGKALGGGLPVSAVVGPARALAEPTASALLTLAGTSVGAAAAGAVLDLLDDDLLDHVRARGAQARELIRGYRGAGRPGSTLVTDVRGRGLLLGVEVDSTTTAALTCYRAWELGCVFYIVRDNVLELTPPLGITAELLAEGLGILTRALDDVAAGAVDPAVLDEFDGW